MELKSKSFNEVLMEIMDGSPRMTDSDKRNTKRQVKNAEAKDLAAEVSAKAAVPTPNPDTLGNQQVAGRDSDEALKKELRRQVDAGEITKDTFKNYMDQQTKRVVDNNKEDRKQDLENVAVNAADTIMDIVGMVPGPIGMVADAAHVGVYAARAQMETDPEKKKELLQRAGMTVLAGIGLPAAVGLAGKGAAKVAPKTATKVATALSGKGALEGGIGGSVAAYAASLAAGAGTATSLSAGLGGNIVGSLVGKALAKKFPKLVTPLMAKTAEKVAAKAGTRSTVEVPSASSAPKPPPQIPFEDIKTTLKVTPIDPKNMSVKDKLAYDKANAESKAASAKAEAEQFPQNGEKLPASNLPKNIIKPERTVPLKPGEAGAFKVDFPEIADVKAKMEADAASLLKAPTTPPTPKETTIKVGSNLLAQFTLAGQLATAQLPASTFNPSGGAAIKDTSSTFTSPATAPVAPKPSSTSTAPVAPKPSSTSTAPVAPKPSSTSTATETSPTKTPSAETPPTKTPSTETATAKSPATETAPAKTPATETATAKTPATETATAKTPAKATETAPAKTPPKATETTKPKKPDTAPKPKGGGILPIPPLSAPDLKTYAYEDPTLKSRQSDPYSVKVRSNLLKNLNKQNDGILDSDRTELAGYNSDLMMGKGSR